MKLADLLKGVEVTELKAPPELEIADVRGGGYAVRGRARL